MYLRARNVSLYFPIHGGITSFPGSARRTGHLGGVPQLYRGRPAVRALDDVTLSLEQGDRLAVIGHNGSGKSTLLRTLAGIYHPQQGTVERDRPVSGIFNMSIGFRQEATGYRNIVLKGLMAGKTHREIEAAVPLIEEFTGLGSYLSMPLHTYSQGMALRLAFAITTTFTHDILVMDEWIGAGDAYFQEKVIARMNSLIEQAHICVIASHSNVLLRRITDRCLWLEDGKVRALGSTQELLDAYEREIAAARAEQEKRLAAERQQIPEGYQALWFEPEAQLGTLGATPQAMELAWNVAGFGIGRIKVVVSNPRNGGEQLVFRGGPIGRRRTGPWVMPGMQFQLRDEVDDLVLATLVAEPRPS